MDLAIVGLGKMGLNRSMWLLRGGHRVVVHNRSPELAEAQREGRAMERLAPSVRNGDTAPEPLAAPEPLERLDPSFATPTS